MKSWKINAIAGLITGILLISVFGNIFTSAISDTNSNTQNMGCTIFTASYGDKVLFGSNEDFNVTDLFYVVVPPSGGNYGYIYFTYYGVDVSSGINEKGLCFGRNGLSKASLNHNPELNQTTLFDPFKVVLATCATIEGVIDLLNNSYLGDSVSIQAHGADATGDAVVVSVGADSKLAFTRKEKGDGFLVSTNFNLANPENRHPIPPYPCWRYETAVEMLEEIEGEDDLTVAKCRSILDAAHLEGPKFIYNTHTSIIYDLKNGIIYLYRFHNYDEVVVLNLEEEFANGKHFDLVSVLFKEDGVKTTETPTPTTTPEVTEEIPLVREKPVIGTTEIAVIGAIIIALIAGLIVFSKRKSRK